MGRVSEDPVKHVISFRVNDREKEILAGLAKQSGLKISSLVRRNLNHLIADNHVDNRKGSSSELSFSDSVTIA